MDGPEYETSAGAANMGCFDGDFVVEFNFYCDTYGIDTISAATSIAFVMECLKQIFNKEHAGDLKLKFGRPDSSRVPASDGPREGFGVDVGQGCG